jgi:hypothetical protein
MSFDPRRALVGLAMAGALLIAPPAIGYAMNGIGPRAHDASLQGVMADNDNADADDNVNAENVNDDNINADNVNDDNVNDDSDNASAAVPAPPAGGAYVWPTTGPSGPPTEDSATNNDPNNNGGNP